LQEADLIAPTVRNTTPESCASVRELIVYMGQCHRKPLSDVQPQHAVGLLTGQLLPHLFDHGGGVSVASKKTGITSAFFLAPAFYLQNTTFLRWAMLDSNQRPPPCKRSAIVCRRLLEFSKYLQISILCA